MVNENLKPKKTDMDKVKSIFDKFSIPQAIDNYTELGKHIHERITQEQDAKGKEIQDMAELKNKLSGATTK